jgi:hypothetical protein
MMSDDEIRAVLIAESRIMAQQAGENLDDMIVDEGGLSQVVLISRAVEREAYRRAAEECRAVAVDFRRTGNQCTDGRYDWKADSAEDCAVAVEALGSEE